MLSIDFIFVKTLRLWYWSFIERFIFTYEIFFLEKVICYLVILLTRWWFYCESLLRYTRDFEYEKESISTLRLLTWNNLLTSTFLTGTVFYVSRSLKRRGAVLRDDGALQTGLVHFLSAKGEICLQIFPERPVLLQTQFFRFFRLGVLQTRFFRLGVLQVGQNPAAFLERSRNYNLQTQQQSQQQQLSRRENS